MQSAVEKENFAIKRYTENVKDKVIRSEKEISDLNAQLECEKKKYHDVCDSTI